MPPPGRRPAQPDQASGLGRHAVGRDQLLLLAHCVEKGKSVRSEADQPEPNQRHQTEARAACDLETLARALGCEHEKRQNDSGRDLDRDARGERDRGGAEARAGSGRERERDGEQQNDERVIVRTAHGQHQQDRVQADEGRCPSGRVAEPPCGPRNECDRGEARGDGDRLERPQRASEAQWHGRVACEREQRAVGRVQERPSDEPKDGVGGRFGGDVGVGV
jgi:hypothetical protein